MFIRKLSCVWREMSQDKSWLTISNFLTLLRILIIPFIVTGIMHQLWRLVFVLFLLAGISDVLDGYLARLLGEDTTLGAYLDPIADKLLLISSFASLSFIDSPSFSIPIWFVLLLFAREIIIVGGSTLLIFIGVKFKVNPSVAGKLTTFFQLLFILWLFVCYFANWNPARTYSTLLIVLALFSVASLVHYGVIGARYLGSKSGIGLASRTR